MKDDIYYNLVMGILSGVIYLIVGLWFWWTFLNFDNLSLWRVIFLLILFANFLGGLACILQIAINEFICKKIKVDIEQENKNTATLTKEKIERLEQRVMKLWKKRILSTNYKSQLCVALEIIEEMKRKLEER